SALIVVLGSFHDAAQPLRREDQQDACEESVERVEPGRARQLELLVAVHDPVEREQDGREDAQAAVEPGHVVRVVEPAFGSIRHGRFPCVAMSATWRASASGTSVVMSSTSVAAAVIV